MAAESSEPATKSPPQILTYYFNDECAWVPAATTYEEALSHAQDAFPELRSVSRDRITYHLNKKARITPPVWWPIIKDVNNCGNVDVRLRKEPEVAAPPEYVNTIEPSGPSNDEMRSRPPKAKSWRWFTGKCCS
ncbi:hypothetical protein BC834DRAFT_884822 [Gloeopeniophorella convolvens]|nr:hypothetical protein BC834DRAFT_884822 [Gloeopeniophorella convolvens]